MVRGSGVVAPSHHTLTEVFITGERKAPRHWAPSAFSIRAIPITIRRFTISILHVIREIERHRVPSEIHGSPFRRSHPEPHKL